MATSATTIRLDNELKEKLTKELSVTGLSLYILVIQKIL